MRGVKLFRRSILSIVRVAAALSGALCCGTSTIAQDLSAIQRSNPPLVLESQGSFYVDGQLVSRTSTDLGGLTAGDIMINQMYVRYMKPLPSRPLAWPQQGYGDSIPVVMMHGGILSGKTYETTPDGRMGWDEYFVRRGHPVYVPDQVTRARSGFDPTVYNEVQSGSIAPTAQPTIIRLSNQYIWLNFRFGPTFGVPFPDTQFPIAAADKFAQQGTPSMFSPPVVATPNPTIKALSDLAGDLNGAVLLTHSQSGTWGFEAVLTNPKGISGIVAIEPTAPTCSGSYTEQQIAALAQVPILVILGDHLDSSPTFTTALVACRALTAQIRAKGGNAQTLHLPDAGIHGNSHMMMMDENNIQIADLILKWIDRNVRPQ